MIEILPRSHDQIIGFHSNDKLTSADYKNVLVPKMDDTVKEYKKVNCVFAMGKDFRGWEMCAVWQDMQLGWRHRKAFEKVAVVGGPRWVRFATRVCSWIFGCLSPAEVSVFEEDKSIDAWKWVEQ
eukprot:Selendium_serpulae@DN2441_c0_g1_i1.p3